MERKTVHTKVISEYIPKFTIVQQSLALSHILSVPIFEPSHLPKPPLIILPYDVPPDLLRLGPLSLTRFDPNHILSLIIILL